MPWIDTGALGRRFRSQPWFASPHNWLVLRINRGIVEKYARLCHGDLLDIGCGDRPYEELLLPYVTRYVGLEHPSTQHSKEKVDVWGDAAALPFPDMTFDTVVAFQVLEHLPEPKLALEEMFRVLRPGGTLILTTPFMWGIHEAPRDFYRYTPYGLTYLLDAARFTDIEVSSNFGYWAMAGLRFSYYLQHIRSRRTAYPVSALQNLVQLAALVLDRMHRIDSDSGSYTTVAYRAR